MCDCVDCVLTTQDCLCKETPLAGVLLEEITDCVIAANLELSNLIGDECLELVCSDDTIKAEVMAYKYFKTLYNRIIYKYWILSRAQGKATSEGMIAKNADDYSDFSHVGKGAVMAAADANDNIIEMVTPLFKEWFENKEYGCSECEETTDCNSTCRPDCGCSKCRTYDEKPYQYISCGCGGNCACGAYDVDDWGSF